MEVARMKAERRSALGRNQVKKLRAEGWMPAVLYGDGKESVSIQISEWELEQHIKSHHKVFQLEISGTPESAFLQEVSWKSTTDRPLHADFLRIDLDKPIESDIEVTLMGHPIGLSKGGSLTKDHLIIRVNSLPTAIPEVFEVDISKMEVGDVLLAKELELPAGVTLAIDPELTICHVVLAAVTADDDDDDDTDADAAAPGEGETPPADDAK